MITKTNRKQKKPHVLVLLAAYNGAKWLEKQIQTILFQRNVDISLVISVDPSSDGTEKLAKRYMVNNINVIVLPRSKKFGSAARNFFHLIREVDFHGYDYIAFSDQDDIWNVDKLDSALLTRKQHTWSGYSSDVLALWPNEDTTLIRKSYPQVKWDHFFESPGPGCTFVLDMKLAYSLQAYVRRNQKVINKIWLHDWFIYAYARSHNFVWHIDNYPSMLYRQHDTNEIGANRGVNATLKRIRAILSGRALRQSVILASIGIEDRAFIQSWHALSRIGLLRLALQSYKCRRRHIDKVLFFCSCIFLTILGNK